MTSIEDDLRDWSRRALEVPNPHLGGLPACPYAQRAWRENKVLVLETDNVFAATEQACREFYSLGKDLAVVASFRLPDIEEFSAVFDRLHALHPTLHCMGFHPGYDAGDAGLDFLSDNEWVSSLDDDYCMIFIQDLAAVVAASDKLVKLGYYSVYPEDEYLQLVTLRKRRFSHGYEAQSNEARRGREAEEWRHGKGR